jgi:hypothetical protein
MTILTGGELEVLMGLRMSWGRLYSNEITRLQNEDDSKHGADSGAYLAHGPANRNEEGVIGVLREMPLHAVEHGSLQRLLAMSKVTVYQYMVLGTNLGEPRPARRWGTRDAIEGLKGSAAILEHTETQVDASSVDSIGFTVLDFDPHSR